MPAAKASPVASSESILVKMEDRKRAAVYDPNDSVPPSKKQATSVNGSAKPHPDADMPWKDDLERFQKDAIWRQMQEYKREKVALETRLKETAKATAYYNDHLRIIDAWFNQITLLFAARYFSTMWRILINIYSQGRRASAR
ncbi:hypothetical protein ASPZODRAFT_863482 [Penicilliopsis zonata CBS 506.65]|uniref:Uncharacterized protein n=1 Tax=Penicilliopsis zonata CBS 506.65 TaxID=1073090 RepID=A0A1L9S9C8_9EURO|nr:hypothetical protein ASPZODRAFT_863482 [Penicilliopsis zonata CBS 506.65]OJJ43758.1 hypothetical protein ASPZODRAFT_863482 [Penicilliopsis zonata CBS 506.65]